jgi:hypothetical protein
MPSTEMTPQAFTDFLSTVFRNLLTHTTDGSIHFIICITGGTLSN